jgi:tripartite-type tricarboxylate transporter receptor subunit TctC
MNFSRRLFLHLTAGAAALPAVSRIAQAQSYPTRPVRIIVGFPPGGANDPPARLIAQWLSERLGQQFIVENRSGAGGSFATEAVAKAAPDGYTLLLTSSVDSWNTALNDNLRFDFIRDIAPVASLCRGQGVLVVHPTIPVRSVSELLTYAKQHPGQLNVASSGIGSGPHVFWELFRNLAKAEMQHIPYRGGGPALIDLLAGQVQVMFVSIAPALPHIRAGTLRALAVTDAMRSQFLPDIPTVAEFIPGYEAATWYGIGAPRNTPAAVVDRLNKEINAGLTDPGMQVRFNEMGNPIFTTSPAEFGRFIVTFTDAWTKVIRMNNIKAE